MMVLLLQNLFLLPKIEKAQGSSTAGELELPKIMETPRVSCDSKWLTVELKTSVPFQGRIYVNGRAFDKRCSAQFLSNQSPNATLQISIMDCARISEEKSSKKQRKYTVWVDMRVDFHPVFITNASQIFRAKCRGVDITDYERSVNVICAHKISPLLKTSPEKSSEFEQRVFQVGQHVVHEWKCSRQSFSKFKLMLRNCYAISRTTKESIQLIDHIGCIVDEEILTNLVAINNEERASLKNESRAFDEMKTVFTAESTLFRFPEENELRFQCSLLLIPRLFNAEPIELPKCSITREDIVERTRRNFSDPYRYIIPIKSFTGVAETMTLTQWIRVEDELIVPPHASQDNAVMRNKVLREENPHRNSVLICTQTENGQHPKCEQLSQGMCSWQVLNSTILLWAIGSTLVWLVVISRKVLCDSNGDVYEVGQSSSSSSTNTVLPKFPKGTNQWPRPQCNRHPPFTRLVTRQKMQWRDKNELFGQHRKIGPPINIA